MLASLFTSCRPHGHPLGFVLMRYLRRQRLIALFAVFALFVATSAYLAHGHGDNLGLPDVPQCDFCLQFAGTGPAAEPEGVLAWTTRIDRLSTPPAEPLPVSRKPCNDRLPPAPPAHA